MDAADMMAHANLVVIEIGNSHVAVATSVDGRIYSHERFDREDVDAATRSTHDAWTALPSDRLAAIAAGSVVPSVLAELRGRLAECVNAPVRVVGEDLHRPLSLAVEAPERVGIDRVCSAAAAYEAVGGACAVASFGTAVTIDCVNDQGVFMGGAILPGLALQARILHEGTAALPHVRIEPTDAVYGANTEQAIRNGIIYGAVGALREITERYATALGAWPTLVVTGGHAELIARHCDFIDRVVPDLCVRGIALAHRRHFEPLVAE